MIISQTPLRISFVGGGTDFEDFWREEGGCVLSSAIDKYVFVIIKERFDRKIYINYSRKEIVDSVDEIQHELVREAMRRTGVTAGVEITMLADVPSEGSGLGSSSSMTVGLLNALYTYQGESRTAQMLAEEACEIEIDILGKPIGKQDQFIAAYGNLRFITFHPDARVSVELVALPTEAKRRLDENLMLFYTGITRRSTEILNQQKANIRERFSTLQEMKRQAQMLRQSLVSGDIDAVGQLMDEGWQLKKSLAPKISNSDLDYLYTRAVEAGAIGGKIAGAGGGGFLLLYCLPDRQAAVRGALNGWRELPFHLERDGTKIIFNVLR